MLPVCSDAVGWGGAPLLCGLLRQPLVGRGGVSLICGP